MLETKVSKRYGKSILSLAIDRGILPQVSADMQLLQNTIEQNKEFRAFLKSPIIKTAKKLELIKKLFSGRINPLTQTFLEFIVGKKRENMLDGIVADFLNRHLELRGITTAVLTTAVGIDDKIRKDIIDIVKNNLKSEVELTEKVDKDIIGGFVLRFKNYQYDTSISHSLSLLRQSFNKNLYIGKINNK